MNTQQIRDRLAHCKTCEASRACAGLKAVALPATVCPLPAPAWLAVPVRASLAQGQYGDALQRVLAPGVALVDSLLGTNLAQCGGCDERRVGLNRKDESVE